MISQLTNGVKYTINSVYTVESDSKVVWPGDKKLAVKLELGFHCSTGESGKQSSCQFTQQGHLWGQMGDDEGV